MMVFLEGPPISKMRHRHRMAGKFVMTYDPQKVVVNSVKNLIRESVRQQAVNHDFPRTNPAHVQIEFFMPIPKHQTKLKENLFRWLPISTKKPDIDNLAKFYLDAANGVIWKDDCQIISLKIKKIYSDRPATIIKVDFEEMLTDENANEILEIVSPEEFSDICTILKEFQEYYADGDTFDRPIWATRAAALLSKLADKYSTHLAKIKKKQPGYWENSRKPPFGQGKIPC